MNITTLYDLRGLVIHALCSGTDRDQITLSSGEKVNSIGHCLNNFVERYLLPTIQDTRLNNIIAVKDSGNDYRKSLYPDYKANRKETDPDIQRHRNQCVDAVIDLLKGLGIPLAEVTGVEADDILAYLVQKLPGPKTVYTVDQDLLQLSSDNCLVFLKAEVNTEGYALYSASPKTLLMTVHPRHVALCKSIVGDTSDNYNGVKGVGPTAFAKLAEVYGLDGLDELCSIIDTDDYDKLQAVIEQTGDKTISKLLDQRDEWRLGWKLANLAPHLVGERKATKFNNIVWTKRLPNPERVSRILAEQGCSYLYPKLKPVLPTKTLITKDNMPDMQRFAAAFKQSEVIAVDWETTDTLQHAPFREATKGREFVDMLSQKLTGSGFTFGKNYEHTIYVSYDHADTNNLPRETLLDLLGLIPDETVIAIQNTLFENTVLRTNFGASLTNCHDTKVMASYVDENHPSGLKDRAMLHLNYKQTKYQDVIAKGKTMSDYSAEHVFQYGADDPLVTAHLYDFYKMVMQIEGTFDFCVANEMEPIEMLSEGFIAGVSVDWEELNRQGVEDKTTFDTSIAKIRELIVANQTPESIESGVERLYAESIDEVVARVNIDFKAGKFNDKDEPALVLKAREEAAKSAALRTKLTAMVTYEPYQEVAEEVELDMTASQINPILEKLGIPRLETGLDALMGFKPADFLKKQQLVANWAEPYKALSAEAALFLRLMVPAVACNDTSKAKLAKGEGRSHPTYIEWQDYAKTIRGESVKTTSSGFEMNLNSPVQMKVLLYGILDLPARLRGFEVSSTKQALGLTTSTLQANEDAIVTALAEDCADHPWKVEALTALLAAKKCQTRISMFYSVYPKWQHPIDGMIHPQVNSCGTETRRPTGSSPNPLQWPKRGEGAKFRNCILPNEKLGHDLIVSIDWSQQELRVAAALSMDLAMLDCFIGKEVEHVLSDEVKELLGDTLLNRFLLTGTKDIHTQTASGLLKWAYDDVVAALTGSDKVLAKKAKEARVTSKPINFGGTYGIGSGKLARQLICPVSEAKQYLADKKALYHGFERWRDSVTELVCQQGYVTTALGNRRHVSEQIVTKDEGLWSSVCRQVVNYLIQGVCADNLKRTMTAIRNEGITQRTGAVLIAPIYDELVFSVHSSKAVDLIMNVHRIMTRDIPGMAVPMLAEPSLGINFGVQIEIGAFPTPEKINEAMVKAFEIPRQLWWHPESDTYLEVTDGRQARYYGEQALDDVTGIAHHEALFKKQHTKRAA